jgi:hypothetical protein
MTGRGRPPESIRHRAYEHACRVYAELERKSVPAAGVTHDGKSYRLFRGSLAELCVDLGYASTSQYAAIRDDLQQMRCIELERRGSSKQPASGESCERPRSGCGSTTSPVAPSPAESRQTTARRTPERSERPSNDCHLHTLRSRPHFATPASGRSPGPSPGWPRTSRRSASATLGRRCASRSPPKAPRWRRRTRALHCHQTALNQ